jgi:hypothetical protein
MGTLDISYAHLDEDELLQGIRGATAKAQKSEKGAKAARRAKKAVAKAHTRDSLQALSKLGELVDGRYRIVSQPPIVVPARNLEVTYGSVPRRDRPPDQGAVPRLPGHPPGRPAAPAGAFRVVDLAHKVVGVGSVGTRAFIVLLQGRDQHDPLFLQIKEATASVLEGYLPREPLPAARRAGGPGAADAAGGQRPLPGLDQGRRHYY